MIIDLFYLLIGTTMLYFGADWIVRSSVSIAKKSKISPLIIGLTIVAFGTSLPELIVSITAALNDSSSLSVGNAIGSNIANIGLVLGLSSLIFPVSCIYKKIKKDLWINIIITIIFIFFAFDGLISRFEGLIMFLCLIYYILLCISEKRDDEEIPENIISNNRIFLFLLGGICVLAYGADLFVDGAISLANRLGISEAVVGVSIVAFGTSLPELATSVVAAFKKESDISLGNILGSNIFNILCVLGISSMISQLESPIQMMNREVYFLFLLGFLLIAISKMNQPISRMFSAILLIIYFYFIYLLF
ncbi:MAG: calcium/sodium antiporter [bacterium TMED144]|nr:MAG: calcium/sodium antiporter [bacterium TMED144]|tara:strand:+ start:3022 stop:3936 length:915 start_codon:yes stop_codon:yes gene_type:complete